MAHKCRCTACGKILRHLGDADKNAEGKYRVFDSAPNLAGEEEGSHRVLECLSCGHFGRLTPASAETQF